MAYPIFLFLTSIFSVLVIFMDFMGAISKDGLNIANKSREIVRNKIKEVLGDRINEFNEKKWELLKE